MPFEKVLLVNPPYAASHWEGVRPPVGLGYLSEELSRQGIEHRVMDMALGYKKRDLFKFVERFNPDLVGVSLLTFRYRDSYDLIKEIKERFPSIPIVAGGPHVSTFEEKVLEEAPSLDYGLTKEGEVSLAELCRTKDHKVKGLIYRHGREIRYNNTNTFLDNLDDFPFPRYGQFSLNQYVSREIGLITSRGCPYNCIFCPVKEAIGKKFRFRRAQGVIEEITYWFKEGYRDILILDDNFTLEENRVYNICEGLIKNNMKGLCLRLSNGVRADRVNESLLSMMRRAGFRYLSFGVEGGNDRVLKAIGKAETIAEIREAVSLAIRLGFEVTLFFLVGSPEERREDIEDSINLARGFDLFDAKFYNLIPFPRTRLFDWIKENNFFVERPEDYLNNASQWDNRPVFATPWFNKEERTEALIYTRRVRRDIRRKAMYKRLKALGIFSGLAAWLFSLDFVQEILQSNRFIRRTAQDVFHGIKNSSCS